MVGWAVNSIANAVGGSIPFLPKFIVCYKRNNTNFIKKIVVFSLNGVNQIIKLKTRTKLFYSNKYYSKVILQKISRFFFEIRSHFYKY